MESSAEGQEGAETGGASKDSEPIPLNPIGGEMFRTAPEDIKPEWLSGNKRFCAEIGRIGGILNGGR